MLSANRSYKTSQHCIMNIIEYKIEQLQKIVGLINNFSDKIAFRHILKPLHFEDHYTPYYLKIKSINGKINQYIKFKLAIALVNFITLDMAIKSNGLKMINRPCPVCIYTEDCTNLDLMCDHGRCDMCVNKWPPAVDCKCKILCLKCYEQLSYDNCIRLKCTHYQCEKCFVKALKVGNCTCFYCSIDVDIPTCVDIMCLSRNMCKEMVEYLLEYKVETCMDEIVVALIAKFGSN